MTDSAMPNIEPDDLKSFANLTTCVLVEIRNVGEKRFQDFKVTTDGKEARMNSYFNHGVLGRTGTRTKSAKDTEFLLYYRNLQNNSDDYFTLWLEFADPVKADLLITLTCQEKLETNEIRAFYWRRPNEMVPYKIGVSPDKTTAQLVHQG